MAVTGGHTILKVRVGSHAHGLAGPDSDVDSRAVLVIPTTALFRVDYRPASPQWTKGDDDEAAWEVGRFLFLATRCHPLILETFLAPIVTADTWGQELRSLLPTVWTPRLVFDSFVAYAANQRKKFLDRKDNRPEKYAVAYLRVLYNLGELLQTGTFTVRIVETPLGEIIGRIKRGDYRPGEVIDVAEALLQEAADRRDRCRHQPDLPTVDEYLIRVRKAFLT
jgi:predicted nucleotidyltransferase